MATATNIPPTIAGRAKRTPQWKISPPNVTYISSNSFRNQKNPGGKTSKLFTTNLMRSKWPFQSKTNVENRMENNVPTITSSSPLVGSTIRAIISELSRPKIIPATFRMAKNISQTSPSATPSKTSPTIAITSGIRVVMPSQYKDHSGGRRTTVNQARAMAMAMRMRIETNRRPKSAVMPTRAENRKRTSSTVIG